MMEVLKKLKGGSLSNTVVLIDGNKKFVRKSIYCKSNREYGLVRWQSQIRKLQLLNKFLPESSVHITQMGFCEDSYYYDIPYHEHHVNCVEALLKGEDVEIVADKVSELLSKMASIKFNTSQGAISVYISEEIFSPLKLALKFSYEGNLPLTSAELIIFKKSVSNAIELVTNLLYHTNEFHVSETLTHGNLTLENILWDSESKKILMIDPYAETYCETIMGDVSQLLQSSASGYEFISNLFEQQDFCIDRYPLDEIPDCLINFSRQLTKKIEGEDWYSETFITLLRASQFIRMFPFKLVNLPRQGVAFMMHGINLLEII